MRLKKTIVALLLAFFLVAPVSVSAAELSPQIQAQITILQQLLTQLIALRDQLLALQGGTTTETTGTVTGGSTLSASVDDDNPLKVTYKYMMNQSGSCDGGTYGIYFGDENLTKGEEPTHLQFPADACNAYTQYSEHTYKKSGTYAVKLYDLLAGSEGTLLAQISVTVSKEGTDTGDTEARVFLDSKTYTSENPTLSGTASGVTSFGISIDHDGKIYGSGNGAIKVSNGRWSHKVSTDLPDGKYRMIAYGTDSAELGNSSFSVKAGSDADEGESGELRLAAELVHSDVEVSDTYTEFEITLQLAAEGGDVYVSASKITEDSSLSSVAANTGWNFDLTNATAAANASTLSSSASMKNGAFVIREGDVEEFTLSAVSMTTASGVQMKLGAIQYGDSATNVFNKTLSLDEDEFETPARTGGTTSSTPSAAVVGVYEGTYPSGVQSSYGYHPEGTINIDVHGEKGKNRDLVLASYEPVNWVLDVDSGVEIGKIIVTGYHKSRVTNVPSGTKVEYHSYDTDGKYYYAYQDGDDAYSKLKSWLSGIYGAGNLGFQFPGYSASSIEAYVGYKG